MMNEAEQHNGNKMMGEHVMESITSGRIKMRSRWYFILRDVLGIIAIIIVLLIAVYLASFAIFVLRQSDAPFVSIFGLAGWYALFASLPLVLIILSAIFIITLAVLGRRYPFGYQWPFLYSILGAIFLIIGVSFLFVQSAFYDQLFSITPVSPQIPFLGTYYPGFGILQSDQIHRGEIVSLTGDGFIIHESNDQVDAVIVTSTTKMPPTAFQAGDMVVVFGDASPTGTVLAVGVQELAQ
jgi:hypothetical protein